VSDTLINTVSDTVSIGVTGLLPVTSIFPSEQTLDPIVQMFEVGLGHTPTQMTLLSMNASNLTEAQLAAAFVSSEAFAAVNNGGVSVDPNAPASASVIDSLFMNTLGHIPTAATLAGFEGLTNEQAFSAFVTSDTVSAVVGASVDSYVTNVLGSILGTVHFTHST
jgi:hypothetical protein